MKNICNYCLALLLLLCINSCRKNDNQPAIKSNTDKLNEALNLKGKLIKGKLPSADSLHPAALNINYYPESVEVAAGVKVYIPYSTSNNDDVSKFYIQVEGATSYWEVSAVIDSAITVFSIEMQIPTFAEKGSFNIVAAAANKPGKVCSPVQTKVIVTDPLPCGTEFEGSVGITVKHLDLGDKKGWVTLSYDTYTIPDRIDIRYNNKWIQSTAGGNIPDSYYPDCSRYPVNGFVSNTGKLVFEYDPSVSRLADVYVTGCDNSTLWTINVNCPNGAFYAGLPDCPCMYADAKAKDGGTEGNGQWLDCGSASQQYHYGAKYEVRWSPSVAGRPGQQCTYDAGGYLITGGIAAGSPDKISPRGCNVPSTNSIDHYCSDVITWGDEFYSAIANCNEKPVPCWQYLRDWKANNGLACSENKVTDISGSQIKILAGDMTCEEVTYLFKAVYESSASSYSITSFFKNGGSLSWSQIRTDLTAIKNSYTSTLNPSKVSALEKAIANIP